MRIIGKVAAQTITAQFAEHAGGANQDYFSGLALDPSSSYRLATPAASAASYRSGGITTIVLIGESTADGIVLGQKYLSEPKSR